MRRRLLLLLLVGACQREAVRDLVERDTDGSALALAACLERTDLPPDACRRVAERYLDRVLAMEQPNDLYCWDATRASQKFAPQRLAAIQSKCKAHR
jgi:hypothetical protein